MIKIAIRKRPMPRSPPRCRWARWPSGERLIWVEAAKADRLGAMRGLSESYSDAILRIVELGG
jgi:hypothetical protein